MLLPRFTLRMILAITTACAVLFVIVGIAFRGETWAWGVVIGVLSLGLAALAHAAWFGIVWCFAQLSAPRSPRSPRPAVLIVEQESPS